MHSSGAQIIGPAALAVLLVAPLLLLLIGIFFGPKPTTRSLAEQPSGAPGGWPILINSTVMYVVAFNLVYFVQELFLVIAKALHPGLRPTLYHNNHAWDGDAPVAQMLQGSGALSILIVGLLALAALKLSGTTRWRLLLFWMAHQGIVQSLPQIPSGVIEPTTDVGDAMNYMAIPVPLQLALGVAALVIMAGLLLTLSGVLQSFAGRPNAALASRIWFAARAALIPAFLAVPIIALYRAPQEDMGELLTPQTMYALMGTPWLVGAAWLLPQRETHPNEAVLRIDLKPFVLAAVILGVFQLVLARGIAFY